MAKTTAPPADVLDLAKTTAPPEVLDLTKTIYTALALSPAGATKTTGYNTKRAIALARGFYEELAVTPPEVWSTAAIELVNRIS